MTIRDSLIPLPEPGSLQIAGPPHWRGLPGIVPITLAFLLATSAPVLAGTVLFGWAAARTFTISVAMALLVESTFNLLTRRSRSWSESHALLLGILLACTLPPAVNWRVPVIGSAIAVLIGQLLPGGVGHYLWHPVALGRVAVQILFHEQLTPERWPVLAPGRLLWGNLSRARELSPPGQWSALPVPDGVDAWLTARCVDHLRSPLPAAAGADPSEAIAALLRDAMPPWFHTLTGVAGGAIGEACAIAIIIGGLVLLWRGFLRWPMVVAGIASAALAAAVLPVQIKPQGGPTISCWLPVIAVWQGSAVGLALVAYHLTAGGFLLVLLLLAPDPSNSPLTSRGHALFGLVIGAVTMLLRIVVGIPASAYWALLVANTLVPVINRATRRRVFGT